MKKIYFLNLEIDLVNKCLFHSIIIIIIEKCQMNVSDVTAICITNDRKSEREETIL